MSDNIKVFRTPMGDLIAIEDKITDGMYSLSKVLSLSIQQSQAGVDVGFGSIAAFSEDATEKDPSLNIEISTEHVMFSYVPNKDLKESYETIIKGRKIVSGKPELVI